MGKLIRSTVFIVLLSSVIVGVLGNALGLNPSQRQILALFNGVLVYAIYFAPGLDKIVRANNAKLEAEMKEDIRKAKEERERTDHDQNS